MPTLQRSLLAALVLAAACAEQPLEPTPEVERPALCCGGPAVYSATDLGLFPGGTFSRANAISSANVVVGAADFLAGGTLTTSAFTWFPGGTMQGLPMPAAGDDVAEAFDINPAGRIVVQSRVSTSFSVRSYLWVPNANGVGGSYISIAPAGGGLHVDAMAVNASGTVVGCFGYGVELRPFRWSVGGGFVDLGVSTWGDSCAEDIDDAGNIVGWRTDASGGVALIRQSATFPFWVVESATWPGKGLGIASAAGSTTVVGYRQTATGSRATRAIVSPPTPYQDLGLADSEARELAATGRIVGWRKVSVSLLKYKRAFTWHNGASTDLPGISAHLGHRTAEGVNACGRIAGSGPAADGKIHAVYWSKPGCD